MKTAIIFGIVVMLFLAACTQNAIDAESPEKVKIGVILPLTGKGADFGTQTQKGIELALKELNKDGKKVEILYQDEKCDTKEAISAYNALKLQDVHVFIGAGCSPSTLAIAPLAEQDKNILITPLSSAETISQAGDYIFRDHTKVDAEFRKLGEWAGKRYKKAAFVYDNTNDAIIQAMKYFSQAFPGETVKVAIVGGGSDYKTELLKVKEADPDLVHVEALPPDTMLVLKQLAELGIKKQITTGKLVGTSEFVNTAGKLAEELIYTIAEYDEKTSPQFWELYKNTTGTNPGIFAAQGYDCLKMLALASEECGGKTDCIKDWLYAVKDYPGAAGITNFDTNGDAIKKVAIMKIQNGKFVKVE